MAIIGQKLLTDWGFNSDAHPHRINFHDASHQDFWIFWLGTLACFASGFLPSKRTSPAAQAAEVH
ncbi:MAG TPA: hypothetical protein PKC18_03395 [Lacipirellulaceae bacterium]|nr:hypothetical protein [Lacipirellulaceae bacterium]